MMGLPHHLPLMKDLQSGGLANVWVQPLMDYLRRAWVEYVMYERPPPIWSGGCRMGSRLRSDSSLLLIDEAIRVSDG